MAPRTCEVCKEAQSKYKCPICLAPYCSLGCFKKHKENPCKKSVPEEELTVQKLPERSYQVDEPNWVVDKEQFQSIVESSEILGALKDGELRKLIQKIDSSEKPENELTRAMEGRTFREFTDKILAVLNPQNQPAN
ncbi:zinc finger HIT domain-containing protein 3 isoform X2 [Phoenix dactylifera]|uniref:Zinc finger HIT domain-containing protein 3 isoform X2 n=1 Tax=Phoenix dactylifera TaxID=42345 RepID=A0A8B7CS51_PHODC|nr:zinc finger HIT domain-containing protein 3 isoform X2 [Phoenix dactylifera]